MSFKSRKKDYARRGAPCDEDKVLDNDTDEYYQRALKSLKPTKAGENYLRTPPKKKQIKNLMEYWKTKSGESRSKKLVKQHQHHRPSTCQSTPESSVGSSSTRSLGTSRSARTKPKPRNERNQKDREAGITKKLRPHPGLGTDYPNNSSLSGNFSRRPSGTPHSSEINPEVRKKEISHTGRSSLGSSSKRSLSKRIETEPKVCQDYNWKDKKPVSTQHILLKPEFSTDDVGNSCDEVDFYEKGINASEDDATVTFPFDRGVHTSDCSSIVTDDDNEYFNTIASTDNSSAFQVDSNDHILLTSDASGVDVDTPLIEESCSTYSEEVSVELTECTQPTSRDQKSPMPIISREHIEEEAFGIVEQLLGIGLDLLGRVPDVEVISNNTMSKNDYILSFMQIQTLVSDLKLERRLHIENQAPYRDESTSLSIADIQQQLDAEIEKNFHLHLRNHGKDARVSELKQGMEELKEKNNELQNELQKRLTFEDSMRDESFALVRVQTTENHNSDINESFQADKMNPGTPTGKTSPCSSKSDDMSQNTKDWFCDGEERRDISPEHGLNDEQRDTSSSSFSELEYSEDRDSAEEGSKVCSQIEFGSFDRDVDTADFSDIYTADKMDDLWRQLQIQIVCLEKRNKNLEESAHIKQAEIKQQRNEFAKALSVKDKMLEKLMENIDSTEIVLQKKEEVVRKLLKKSISADLESCDQHMEAKHAVSHNDEACTHFLYEENGKGIESPTHFIHEAVKENVEKKSQDDQINNCRVPMNTTPVIEQEKSNHNRNVDDIGTDATAKVLIRDGVEEPKNKFNNDVVSLTKFDTHNGRNTFDANINSRTKTKPQRRKSTFDSNINNNAVANNEDVSLTKDKPKHQHSRRRHVSMGPTPTPSKSSKNRKGERKSLGKSVRIGFKKLVGRGGDKNSPKSLPRMQSQRYSMV